jgi:nucleoside-diphosphate-sugar epimerase
MKNNTKVLVVGINGFLGKELSKFLKEKGVIVFGTTHTANISNNIFQLKIGGSINKALLQNNFSSVVYLSHSATIEGEKLIDWYKKIFMIFKGRAVEQIYISSYSAHKQAVSNYGKSKYKIERFFIENNEYSISPGLIIGKGGVFNKIAGFIDNFPIIVVPVSSKENQVPIVSIDKVCDVIFNVIQGDFISKNYNIYSHMVKLEDLIKTLIQINSKKKYLLRMNGYFILNVIKVIESIGIKLPISSDSLSGFIANQKYSVKSEILEFGDDLSIEIMIARATQC